MDFITPCNVYIGKVRLPYHIRRIWESNLFRIRKAPETGDAEEAGPSSGPLVASDYRIVYHILSEYNSWRDLKAAGLVSKVWSDVVKVLTDDCTDYQEFYLYTKPNGFLAFVRGADQINEPMLVLCFTNMHAKDNYFPCNTFPKLICETDCGKNHRMLDYVNTFFCYPNPGVMVGLCCSVIVFYPERLTTEYFSTTMLDKESFIGGVRIPKIAGVNMYEFSSSQISLENTDDEFTIFYALNSIMHSEVIKCIILFVGKQFMMYKPFTRKLFDMIKNGQGEKTPLAVGGCQVDCSFNDDYNFLSGNNGSNITLLVFSVDKNAEAVVEFDAYSIVFPPKMKALSVKPKMDELARVPKRRFSFGIKFGGKGRLATNLILEDELFRQYFRSVIVGCCSNQEFGTNSYPRLTIANVQDVPSKRRRPPIPYSVSDLYFFSSATVFVVLTWGDPVPSLFPW